MLGGGKVFEPVIQMRQHAWVIWAEIAIDHEAESRTARAAGSSEEFRPGLVAFTASAFALDALHQVAGDIGITIPQGKRHGNQGGRVAERLKRGAPGSTTDWPKRIRDLFAARKEAVHFGEKTAPPVFHPALNSHVSAEVYTWRLEAAEDAVDLLLEVLDAWANQPSKLTKDWARDYGHAVATLKGRRVSLRK